MQYSYLINTNLINMNNKDNNNYYKMIKFNIIYNKILFIIIQNNIIE